MKLDQLRVFLGGIEFATGQDVPAPEGWMLTLHELRGWDETVPDATETYESVSGDGQHRGLTRAGVRQVTLTGLVLAREGYGPASPSGAATAIKRLGRTTLRVVEGEDLVREIDVVPDLQLTRLSGAPQKARYTLTLTADDPLISNAGSITVGAGETWIPNRGDKQAYPIIEAGGPVTIFIESPAGTCQLNLGSGLHTVDTRDGIVWTPAGIELAGAVIGPWPYVRPGGSLWNVSGIVSGAIRVKRWEAWS